MDDKHLVAVILIICLTLVAIATTARGCRAQNYEACTKILTSKDVPESLKQRMMEPGKVCDIP